MFKWTRDQLKWIEENSSLIETGEILRIINSVEESFDNGKLDLEDTRTLEYALIYITKSKLLLRRDFEIQLTVCHQDDDRIRTILWADVPTERQEEIFRRGNQKEISILMANMIWEQADLPTGIAKALMENLIIDESVIKGE